MTATLLRPTFVMAWVTACLPGVSAAQVRVIISDGEVVVEQGGGEDAAPRVIEAFEPRQPGRMPPAPPGVGLSADAAGLAIGDPWWDDAPEPAARSSLHPAPRPRTPAAHRVQTMESLRRELSLVRAACPDLGPEARGSILAAGRAAVEARPAGAPGAVEAAVARALQAAASPAAAAAFQREVAARETRRRAAAAAVLLEAVDQDALLDARTRRDLAQALAAAWQPAWDQVAAVAARQRLTGTRLPSGVEDVVATVLDADSLAAWRERREPTRP